jgi:hypothetical protein
VTLPINLGTNLLPGISLDEWLVNLIELLFMNTMVLIIPGAIQFYRLEHGLNPRRITQVFP